MDSRDQAEMQIAAEVRQQIESTGQYNQRDGGLEYHGADCEFFTRHALAVMAAGDCPSTTMTLLRDLRDDLIDQITRAEIKARAAELARLAELARYGVAA